MPVAQVTIAQHIFDDLLGKRAIFIMRDGKAYGGMVDNVASTFVFLTDAGQVLDVDPITDGSFSHPWRPILTHWHVAIADISAWGEVPYSTP